MLERFSPEVGSRSSPSWTLGLGHWNPTRIVALALPRPPSVGVTQDERATGFSLQRLQAEGLLLGECGNVPQSGDDFHHELPLFSGPHSVDSRCDAAPLRISALHHPA